jgi:hypothetical protein
MESLYEFKGERTAKMIKEATLAHFFKRPLIYLLTAAFLALMFYIQFSRVDYSIDNLLKLSASICGAFIVFLIFAAIWFFFLFFVIRNNIKLTIARDKESAQGKNVVCHTSFYGDRVENRSDRAGKISDMQFLYTQIKRVRQSKNCVFLYTKESHVIIVEKSAIVKGDINTFYDFIKSKI